MKITVEQAKQVLKENGIIQHFWSVEDIKATAKDMEIELTELQLNDIVSLIENNTDCNIGVNWETIQCWIDYVITK